MGLSMDCFQMPVKTGRMQDYTQAVAGPLLHLIPFIANNVEMFRLNWGLGAAAAVFGVFAVISGTAGPAATDSIPVSPDRGAAGLSRWLHALQMRASLLMVTAHPDDEDGGMLAYETRGLGARAVLLTLNRGEGGQNAMSPELYDALGLVRTQELLQADRYYGVDQYWANTIDYGFSKTREEALEKWGQDRVLADVVRVIRMTRPLVITSVFVGAATDGHGNHQVAGQIAQEAFLAAGDPTKFPEQIKEGLRPWKPLKVYAHVPFFELTPKGMYDYAIDKYVPVRFFDYIHKTWSSTIPSTTLEIQEGAYAPVNGLTYLQIGREGLGEQKTQNNGVSIPASAAFASAYHRYDSIVPAADREESFFDGVDVSVNGIGSLAPSEPDYLRSGLAEISRIAADANRQYQPDRPQAIAPLLADGLRLTRALIGRVHRDKLDDVEFELRAKEDQFEHALTDALGLDLQAAVMPDREPQGRYPFGGAAPTFTIAIPGQAFGVQVDISDQGPENVAVESVSVASSDGKAWRVETKAEPPKSIAGRQQVHAKFAVSAPADAALTRPYFSRKDEEQPVYDLDDPQYRNLSAAAVSAHRDCRDCISGRGAAPGAGGPNAAPDSGAGDRGPAAADGSGNFRFRLARCRRGAGRDQVVRLLLHGPQQCERPGGGHFAAAVARGLALGARIRPIFDGARRQGSHRHVFGAARRSETRGAGDHGGGRI